MILKDLKKVYVYEPVSQKDDGEYTIKYKLIKNKERDYFLFNVQQDISELDINPSGYVDYDILKLRSDKYFELKKNYGISLEKIENDEDGFTINKPTYYVKENPKTNRTILYICHLIQ